MHDHIEKTGRRRAERHDLEPGQRFGRLVVSGPRILLFRGGRNRGFFPCRCDCGERPFVSPTDLVHGTVVSCGCFKDENTARRNTRHGLGRGRLFNIWSSMRGRCGNPNYRGFHRYGGRGISVCPEWRESYAVFHKWAHSNGYADDLTIERIDNDGNYEPGNCTWIPLRDQCKNKSATRNLEAFGETKMISEWLKDPRCGVRATDTIHRRLGAGWSVEQAIGIPSLTWPAPRT